MIMMDRKRMYLGVLGASLVAGCVQTPAASSGESATACPAVDPALAGEWYQGPAAFEHADSARTHLFKTIPEPDARDLGPASTVSLQTHETYPGVYNFAVRSPGEVYVLGGATSGRLDGSVPYVARVDMPTGRDVWRTELPKAPSGDGKTPWTYPGVVGIPANGDIYAVQDNRLTRLDPESGRIVAQTDLPIRGAAADSGYNGFSALPDGKLVLKSHHRPADCDVDGFRAFLACGTDGASASVLAVVDPETMEIVGQADAPELIGGRITVTEHDGTAYVYAPGLDNLHRFAWRDGQLSYDDDWAPVRYREGRETPATAAAVLGEFVIVQSNALPTDVPSRLTAISQSDPSTQFTVQPFADRARSMIPSMPSVDPELGLIFVTDGLAPGLAALRLDPERGFETVWRAEQGSLSFSALVGPRDGRVLVSSDIADGYRPDYTREAMVWRRAETGEILARSDAFARMGGTVLAPDCDGVVYTASSRAPEIHRLQVSTRAE